MLKKITKSMKKGIAGIMAVALMVAGITGTSKKALQRQRHPLDIWLVHALYMET